MNVSLWISGIVWEINSTFVLDLSLRQRVDEENKTRLGTELLVIRQKSLLKRAPRSRF